MAVDLKSDVDRRLAELMIQCRNDPLLFVKTVFPWGQPGTSLSHVTEMQKWQEDYLIKLRDMLVKEPFDGKNPVLCRQIAVASGHGVGKSALSCWLILWIMSTRPDSKGTITANSAKQLKTKTWGELSKWLNMCVTREWFEYHNAPQNMSLCHVSNPNEWRCDAITCKEENSEAFAGQHAHGSSSWYLFDEASAIPSVIWKVTEGGKFGGEPFHFVFGNPTRKDGMFFDCFHDNKSSWETIHVDSRDSTLLNNEQIEVFLKTCSTEDEKRFRVYGKFPETSEDQFIATNVIEDSKNRIPSVLDGEPLICGIDVARGGDDFGVIQFRRGNDARTFKKYKIPGRLISDSTVFIDLIDKACTDNPPDMMYIDETGMGGPIKDELVKMGYPCKGIHFGNSAINSQAFHLRTAEMYNNIKDWLQSGGCINPRDAELINQLKAREYGYNEKGQLVIESKKVMKSRCAKSPDDSDALALTLAYPHRNNNLKKQPKIHKHQSYKNPLGHDSLESFYK